MHKGCGLFIFSRLLMFQKNFLIITVVQEKSIALEVKITDDVSISYY